MNRLAFILARLALLALVLAAWEWLPRLGIVNPLLLPPLSDVLAMLGPAARPRAGARSHRRHGRAR